MKTLIPVLYRDGDNYKTRATIVVRGPVTPDQLEQLGSMLDVGGFIAEQVGLDHAGYQSGWDFPDESDHCWHELELDDVSEVDDDQVIWDHIGSYGSAEHMLSAFHEACTRGWDDVGFALEPTARRDDGDAFEESEEVFRTWAVSWAAGDQPRDVLGQFAEKHQIDAGASVL